jgi:hypothetical protein
MTRLLRQTSPRELPAQRDQGLGGLLRERADRPLKAAVRAERAASGWTGHPLPRAHGLTGPENEVAGGGSDARQALGGSSDLSLMR